MARVLVVVKPDGTTEMKVEGISGPACLKATKELEDALGKVAQRVKTAEFDAVADKGTVSA